MRRSRFRSLPPARSLIAAALFVSSAALAPIGAHAQQLDPALYGAMRWRLIGPFRAGRTVAAAGIPDQPNVFFVGATDGGVWKTTDYGRTWTPIFDGQPTGSIGTIAVAPSDPRVMYVGSGEALIRPDLSVGDGIYRSTDGGTHWTHLGLRDGQQIASIIVDPHDPDRLFAAVLGHPYGPNGERGVFRSTDGGTTWKKVLYRDENTGAADLAFDPANANVVYAVLWAGRHAPWSTGGSYSAPGSGLYRSTDGGDSWHQIGRGLPTWAEKLGRIGITVAPSNPRRMYAMVDANPDTGGVYRSDDGGESWTRVNHEERVWGRGDDFAWVRADPRNPDIVYVCNTSTYRSTDGGHTFTAIKGAPGGDDYHAIWINPLHPEIMLLAVDQGATITVNGGATWSSWYNQPTAQFYHVATDTRFPYWVYGGQQESGSVGIASRGDAGEITFRDWHPVGTEEYGYVAPDPLDPNIVYGGKVTRMNQATGEVQNVAPEAIRSGKYRFDRTAPLVFSDADPHALFLGSSVLFRTTDGGMHWSIVSPDLTRADPGIPPTVGPFLQSDPAHGRHRGVIYSIAPSHHDPNTIWVGTDDGLIQVTHDGGAHWSNVTPPALTPWSKIAQLDASHFDEQTVYAAVNRIRLDDLRPHIYRTHDGGRTWQEIVTGLPANAPVNVVREDPVRKGLLYAGTETSVYVSFDDGDHWQSLQLNLPATSMRDLVVRDSDLVVGTHGRSFWILDDVTPLRQITAHTAAKHVSLFRPEGAFRIRRDINTDTPLPPEEPAGQNPPDGAILDYWLGAAPSAPVSLEIDDAQGHVVRRYASTDSVIPTQHEVDSLNVPAYWIRPGRVLPATAGMHRWVWDLRGAPPAVLRHSYPISAIYHDTPRDPRGVLVLPGTYTARLTVDGRTYTQPLVVRMDPRITISDAALAQQWTLATQIVADLGRDFQAIRAAGALNAALDSAATRSHGNASALRRIAALRDTVAAIAGGGGKRLLPGGQGATPTLVALNGELATLLGIIEGVDAEPTSQAIAAVARVHTILGAQLTRWKGIRRTAAAVPQTGR